MHAVGDKVSRHKAFPGQDNNHWCPVIHLGGERGTVKENCVPVTTCQRPSNQDRPIQSLAR